MRKKVSLFLVVIMVLSMITACTNAGTTKQVTGDTITIVSMMKAESFDPISGASTEKITMHAIYDTLVKFGQDAEILPCLAESWTESADSMSYTFNLRKDVKFHDGTPFTAEDVIFTFDTMMKTPIFMYNYQFMSSWEKVDDYTVKIYKANAYSKLLNFLAEISYIVPEDTYTTAFEGAPIGTGPYKFVSQEEDGSVKLIGNEEYYLGAPNIKNIIVKVPLDPSTAVIALETGEVDFIMGIPLVQVPIIEGNDKLEYIVSDSWSMNTIMMMGDRFQKDNNLRKAIFHGINRRNTIDIANNGEGTEAKDLFAERLMGERSGVVPMTMYDETLAKEYLLKSNYKLGDVIKITIEPSGTSIAQSIQADLKKIGIEIEIEQLDMNAWATKLMNGEIDMTLITLGTNMITVENMLMYWSIEDMYYGKNMESTSEYEDLLIKIAAEKDLAKRNTLVKRALEIQYELANIAPLYAATLNFAHSKEITGFEPISASTYVYYLGDLEYAK